MADEPSPLQPPAPASPRSRVRSVLSGPWRLVVNLDRARTLGLATEMAFWLFLALLPIAAVLGMVVAKLAMRNEAAVAPILDPLPEAARGLVTRELARVSAWNGGAVAPFAAAVFVWFASGGVHAVFDALELQTESKPRPWWKKRLLALATCLVLSIGGAGLTLLGTGLDWVRTVAVGRLPDLRVGTTSTTSALDLTVRLGLGAALLVLLHLGIFWIGLPSATRRRMPLWHGAVFSSALEVVMGYAYGRWLAAMGTQSAYQASLSIVAITMVTLWLFAVALLSGAELNQLVGVRRLAHACAYRAVESPPGVTSGMVACEGARAGTPSRRPRSRASRPVGSSLA